MYFPRSIKVFLTAQIYNVQADSAFLLLLWGILVLPVVYFERSTALAVLFMAISYFWLGYLLDDSYLSSSGEYSILVFFLFALIWFEIGTLHYLKKTLLGKIGRVYRLVSIQISLIGLFILSFEDFLRAPSRSYDYADALEKLLNFQFAFGVGAVILVLFALVNYFLKLAKNSDELAMRGFSLLSVILIFGYLNFMEISILFAIFFNFILIGVSICLIYFGYKREDPKLINMGAFWLGLLILARYFDFFYDMLPTSLFFLFGGIILLAGGFVLERSRRELLSHIKGEENA